MLKTRMQVVTCIILNIKISSFGKSRIFALHLWFNKTVYSIDATPESGRLGRLVNHSRNGNLVTKSICVDGLPRLVLIAKEDLKVGEEISYDYGDHSKEALRNYPWLAF